MPVTGYRLPVTGKGHHADSDQLEGEDGGTNFDQFGHWQSRGGLCTLALALTRTRMHVQVGHCSLTGAHWQGKSKLEAEHQASLRALRVFKPSLFHSAASDAEPSRDSAAATTTDSELQSGPAGGTGASSSSPAALANAAPTPLPAALANAAPIPLAAASAAATSSNNLKPVDDNGYQYMLKEAKSLSNVLTHNGFNDAELDELFTASQAHKDDLEIGLCTFLHKIPMVENPDQAYNKMRLDALRYYEQQDRRPGPRFQNDVLWIMLRHPMTTQAHRNFVSSRI